MMHNGARQLKTKQKTPLRPRSITATQARAWLERAPEQVRGALERAAPADAWGDFFAAAAPGVAAAAQGLARDTEAERRQAEQREAAEREAQEHLREQERREHQRDRDHDYGL